MKRIAGLLLATLALASAARAQELVTEKLNVSHQKPSQILAALTAGKADNNRSLPLGVQQASPNDKDNTIIVQGSPRAVALFRQAVGKLDVPPRIVQVKLRLVRVQQTADGKQTEETLQSPIITTIDGTPAVVSIQDHKNGRLVGGWRFDVLPRLESDKSVTLSVALRKQGARAERAVAQRQVPAGQSVRILGMTDSSDRQVRKAVRHGLVPQTSGAYSAYYVEVTPAELP